MVVPGTHNAPDPAWLGVVADKPAGQHGGPVHDTTLFRERAVRRPVQRPHTEGAPSARPYTGRSDCASRSLEPLVGSTRLAALVAPRQAAAAGGAAQAASARLPPAAALTAGVQETVLPNGLTRARQGEVRNAPVVSFSVWYRVGSRNEHTGITGMSHLLEHMLFKGNAASARRDRADPLLGRRAVQREHLQRTGRTTTQRSPPTGSSLAMSIEADRMVNSRIDKAVT